MANQKRSAKPETNGSAEESAGGRRNPAFRLESGTSVYWLDLIGRQTAPGYAQNGGQPMIKPEASFSWSPIPRCLNPAFGQQLR